MVLVMVTSWSRSRSSAARFCGVLVVSSSEAKLQLSPFPQHHPPREPRVQRVQVRPAVDIAAGGALHIGGGFGETGGAEPRIAGVDTAQGLDGRDLVQRGLAAASQIQTVTAVEKVDGLAGAESENAG